MMAITSWWVQSMRDWISAFFSVVRVLKEDVLLRVVWGIGDLVVLLLLDGLELVTREVH